MESFDPKFSIIISTYNRADLLRESLHSVLRQGTQDFEIIVSDDASTDDTRKVVSEFHDARITYLCNQKNLGISATRNAAIKLAKGEYLVVMDDDTNLRPDFLEQLKKAADGNRVGLFCPRILDPQTKEPFVQVFNRQSEKHIGYFEFNYFIGLAHVILRDTVEKCGYYDERFGVGAKYFSAEESDYFFRLKMLGGKVLYCPDLIVYHRRQREIPDIKVYRYSYGIAAMLTKRVLSDPAHFYLYLYILLNRITVAFIRSLQVFLLPETIKDKEAIYKYRSFFSGSLRGAFDYLRFR